MPRRYNIRWSEADEAELNRVVRNFNDKIRRLEKKQPENAAYLPEKISAADKRRMRELIQTRQDLKRELNSLRRFSQKGAEEIVVIPDTDYNLKVTKWQRRDMLLRQNLVNRRRAAERERLENVPVSDRGEAQGYTRGQVGMGKAELRELDPIRAFTRTMGNEGRKRRARTLRKQSMDLYWNNRNEIMRENYIDTIRNNFPPKMVDDIIAKIEGMPFDQFRSIFESNDQHKFEYNYPLNYDKQVEYSTALRSVWIPKNGELKKDYIEKIDAAFPESSGKKQLIGKLKKMKVDDFLSGYESSGKEYMNLLYPQDDKDADVYLKALINLWK